MSITNLTPKQLRRAAQIKEQVEKLQNELGKLLGSNNSAPTKAVKKKRKMSAAGRKSIAAAQKKRWAKINAARAKKK